MEKLSWISDENLENAVRFLLEKAATAKSESESSFQKNVIDPFAATFEISGFNIDFDTWITSEKTRQAQKSLQNHIGDFHQVILGNVIGWQNLKTGGIVDILSNERKIIAEIKNKYNTVTGSNLSDLYKALEALVMPKSSIYKGFTAYYVTVIPKKPHRFNLPFVPSDKGKGSKCAENEKIRIIDGASFYELVTGEEDALENLFTALPEVILEVSGKAISASEKKGLSGFFKAAFG